ncbi:MAG: VCBS repeat-containing protein, partial [Flavobacteriales bacterium]|nr:VCBS repeat-containing protein [Flavobacteriales bacterium]
MRIAFSLFALFLFSRSYAQFGGLQPVDTIAIEALLVADLDSDGDGDLLATSPQGLIRYRNLDGSGDLGAAEILLSIGMGDHVNATCADLDADGDNDILFGRASDSTIYWMPNTDGLGNFGAPSMVAALPAPMLPPGSRSVHAADITGDGLPEAIAACAGSSNVFWCA